LTTDFIGDLLEVLHHLLVFVAAAAIKSGTKDGNDFEHILHQIFFKTAFFSGIDDPPPRY
jgi:hypothetical protein